VERHKPRSVGHAQGYVSEGHVGEVKDGIWYDFKRFIHGEWFAQYLGRANCVVKVGMDLLSTPPLFVSIWPMAKDAFTSSNGINPVVLTMKGTLNGHVESTGSQAETATLGKKTTRPPPVVHILRNAPNSYRSRGVLGGNCNAFRFGLSCLGCFGALFDIKTSMVAVLRVSNLTLHSSL